MRRLLLVALAALLVAPAPARAADPIMPLADVQPGLRCTGLSVVRGLDIASFDAEVLDVLDRRRPSSARIIVRVSGGAVDATGVGPGFSGSPIICTGTDGVARNIGAISETIGEFGGRTVLATPIEAILAQPVLPPAATRSSIAPGRTSIIGARRLAGPLTIAGLRSSLARGFIRAARKAGRVLIASPAGTRAAFPPQPLVPGAAVSVGLTSGDISIGEAGTVAYADGLNVWLYGHPLDGAGRRSLFLQDAYIHTVVNNPVAAPEIATYKLATPGNDVGTVSSDGPSAVVGMLGALPPSFPLRVTVKDLDSGKVRSSLTNIADEGDVGLPTGGSPLGLAAAAAAAESAATILGGSPARQTGELCMKVTLRELRKPMRVCWNYAVDGITQNALAGAVASDVATAVATLETYKFGTLHPTTIELGMRVRRGLRQAYILGARGPARVRRGQTIRLRLALRQTGSGKRTTRTVRLRVPLSAPTGLRTLRLEGTPADSGGDPNEEGELSLVFEDEEGPTDDTGPQSVDEVRDAFLNLKRYDGVSARLGDIEAPLFRDPRLRISGEARVELRIR
ncbi:MAG TPA: hypothetical protein VNA28_05580 [Solirubrobacteraceae bacterium]|nr:hypothetical protein [Solirubrobacteraceae bacterium]